MGSGAAGCVEGTRILEGIGPPRKRGRAGKAGRKDWGRWGGGTLERHQGCELGTDAELGAHGPSLERAGPEREVPWAGGEGVGGFTQEDGVL